jgi:phosphotransferase system enzyme I (PtsI)
VILMVRRAATRRGIPVSLCGEMASDPALLMLLVGLGLTEFSMTPGAIGVAKDILGECRSDDLRALAKRILKLATIDDIEQELLGTLGRLTVGPTTTGAFAPKRME